MVDINALPPRLPDRNGLGEEQLRQAIELLFFAYRDMTAGPDAMLAQLGFGRAHHRAIHFIGRNPGMTVAELLGLLRVTKQSLSRVLREVIAHGFVVQRRDDSDARRRLLHLTARGVALEATLSTVQQERMARAFASAGPDAVLGWTRVLWALVEESDRDRLQRAHARRTASPAAAAG